MTEKQLRNFWKKVDIQGPDDCWNWIAGTNDIGCGSFNLNGRMLGAHRIAYEVTYGPISEGFLLFHKCDNPSCVNPRHLFLGTNQDRVDTMVDKDRNFKPKGEKHNMHKLTEDQVLEIRRLYALEDHLSGRQLAKLFGVVHSTILRIVARKRWNHI